MMLVPLATGAAVAVRSGSIAGRALVLFVLAAMSLFWLRTPLEAWLGTSAIKAKSEEERSFVLKVIVVTLALAATSSAALLAEGHARGLLIIGAVSALAFAVQAVVKKLGRSGRMPAQIIGAIGLTSTAAGAYYVATGRLDATALTLWFANWLFAGDQIHFVQVRIHASRAQTFDERMKQGSSFFVGQVALIGVVFAACRIDIFPAAMALAFLPALVRGTLWFVRSPQSLDVHKLGFAELTQSLLFGVLVSAAFLV
jgi:hypothetical protein